MMISSGGKFIEKYTLFRCVVASIFVIISTAAIPCLAVDEHYSVKKLTYITEQFPPYNYQEGGKLQGISVDLLEKMWNKMNVNSFPENASVKVVTQTDLLLSREQTALDPSCRLWHDQRLSLSNPCHQVHHFRICHER